MKEQKPLNFTSRLLKAVGLLEVHREMTLFMVSPIFRTNPSSRISLNGSCFYTRKHYWLLRSIWLEFLRHVSFARCSFITFQLWLYYYYGQRRRNVPMHAILSPLRPVLFSSPETLLAGSHSGLSPISVCGHGGFRVPQLKITNNFQGAVNSLRCKEHAKGVLHNRRYVWWPNVTSLILTINQPVLMAVHWRHGTCFGNANPMKRFSSSGLKKPTKKKNHQA